MLWIDQRIALEKKEEMNKKQLIVAFGVGILLSGCATINFSSKYYTLPSNYKNDIDEVWNDILFRVPLKHKELYSYKIIGEVKPDKYVNVPTGILYNRAGTINLPNYLIKYIWEFYYPSYHKKILTCLFLHEIAHTESGYSDKPPEQHYLCDKYAVNLMLTSDLRLLYNSDDFYSSLIVVSQYWSARKGAGGHLFNIGWNAANVGSLIFLGYGYLGDLFATDISTRLSLFKKDYPNSKFIFKRSH